MLRFPGIEANALAKTAIRVLGDDPAVAALLGDGVGQEANFTTITEASRVGRAMPDAELPDVMEEVIVQKLAPVYRVVDGRVDFSASASATDIWGARVEACSDILAHAFPAIGRIEARIAGNRYVALGTAWLIDPEVAVTNRHVADYFAEHGARGLAFKRLLARDAPMSARVDFADDATLDADDGAPVVEVLYLSPARRPDVAFIRLARSSTQAPAALRPMRRALTLDDLLCVVGYPELDDRADRADIARLYGDVFGRKRLAPGLVKSVDTGVIRHLCNTLGGNSGSPVLDLSSGEVAGLHFGGHLETENYAEPIELVARLFRDMSAAPVRRRIDEAAISGVSAMSRKITIPITVTVEVGDPLVGDQLVGAAAVPAPSGSPAASLDEAVESARALLAGRDDVIRVRRGWKVTDGWITDTPAVVVAIERKLAPDVLEAVGRTAVPSAIEGFAVDIALASPADLFGLDEPRAFEERAPSRGSYRSRPDFPLTQTTEEMRVRVQPGPDAGSTMLTDFLKETRQRLTVAMYRFSAPHILKAVIDDLGTTGKLKLVMDMGNDDIGRGAKKDDLAKEETRQGLRDVLGPRLRFQAASKGRGGVFATSYHIKVAVRDGNALWMSSGSWQSSNQPKRDPLAEAGPPPNLFRDHNREMHMIVENETLARLYEKHIDADFDEAKEAEDAEEAASVADPLIWLPDERLDDLVSEAPVAPRYFPAFDQQRMFDVQPILTPDNYAEHVLAMLTGATRRIWFQNQSLNLRTEMFAEYRKLLDTLKQRQRDGLDVRIIVRGEYARDILERLKSDGFRTDRSSIHIQDRCHNKMIIVDDDAVIIGSHNWTNDGTLTNRDASLLFRDRALASYCADIFDYDWQRTAGARLREDGPAAKRAVPGERVPHGMYETSLSSLGVI